MSTFNRLPVVGVGQSFQVATPQIQYLYVSTTGSDSTGTGSVAAPFATIDKARSTIRATGLNTNMIADVVVVIAPGDYWVTSTISFTEADSSSNGFSVRYRADGAPGCVRLRGGRRVTGWTQHSGNVYKASVSGDFWTMYENGRRGRKARKPNYVADSSHPCALAPYFLATGVDVAYTTLAYNPSDIDPTGLDLTDVHVTMWSGGVWNWFTDTTPISSVNTGTHQFTLSHETRHYISQIGVGSRYYLEGALTFLDQPGEWHHDKTNNLLYYYAVDGPVAQQEIVIPAVTRIIQLVGSSQSTRVTGVVFDGIEFDFSDFVDWFRYANWGSGPDDTGHSTDVPHTWQIYDHEMQLDVTRHGQLYMENVDNITVQNCHFKNAGLHGIYARSYAKQVTIQHSWFDHTGHSGIYFDGPYPAEGDTVRDNTIYNCKLNNVGELVGHGTGIYLAQSGHNSISHVEIYNGPRTGIHITSWTDLSPITVVYAVSNTIQYAKLHDLCQDSGDVGAFEIVFLTSKSGGPYNTNFVSQMTVDNISAHASMTDVAPNGVFTDNQTYGQSFTNVWVTNTTTPRRNNDSGEHTETNCSWNGGFNSSLVDVANIGVTSSFPF